MKQRITNSIIFGVLGLVIALIYYTTNIPSDKTVTNYLKVLSDSCLIPGVIVLCMYVLTLVSKEGIFDGLTYSFKYVVNKFVPSRKVLEDESYYDYKKEKAEKRKSSYVEALVVSIFFICLSILFYLLYKVY